MVMQQMAKFGDKMKGFEEHGTRALAVFGWVALHDHL